jgi:hypothetical protein
MYSGLTMRRKDWKIRRYWQLSRAVRVGRIAAARGELQARTLRAHTILTPWRYSGILPNRKRGSPLGHNFAQLG